VAILDNLIVRRLIGWLIVTTSVYTILLVQVQSVVSAETGLPAIRHPVFWHHDLYDQALANRNKAVSTELAPFYLIERVLGHAELIVTRPLDEWSWKLEAIGRTRVTMDYGIGELPAEPWRELEPRASHAVMLGKRKLYLLADPAVTTYIFVATDGGPLYIVPETVYRSRVADSSGANLRAP
jgi:hypothetical protein